MQKFEPLLDHHTPWLCYRSTKNANLIYFSCNKCASTFYDEFFKKLNWVKITTQDIDWSEDYVFSYIRNPLVRHRKGIVEGIFTFFPEMKSVFVDHPERFKFLANLTSIEAHSYSIHRMLGDNAKHVHWIPIDTELDHKQHTLNILAIHNENIDQETATELIKSNKVNESTVEEIEFFNQLCSIKTPPEILRYIDFDICLYNKVTTPPPHVVAEKYYAERIQELLDQGLLQDAAEKIVDVEVYNIIDRKQKKC
jgi:hypothetical protein